MRSTFTTRSDFQSVVIERYRDDPCAMPFKGFYRNFPFGRRGKGVVKLVGVVLKNTMA